MIGYLNGKILENADGRVLVAVGAEGAGSVGYQVSVPHSPSYLGLVPGARTELFVYTHVREDALDLFGFVTAGEKHLFLTLLSVNGIGPKGALAILSGAEMETLVEAIASGDKDFLTRLPGIGKKTAERVVLELADPIRKKREAGLFGSSSGRSPVAQLSLGDSADGGPAAAKPMAPSAIFNDAKAALIGLGFKENDVISLLNRVVGELEKKKQKPKHPEDLIRTALREIGS